MDASHLALDFETEKNKPGNDLPRFQDELIEWGWEMCHCRC